MFCIILSKRRLLQMNLPLDVIPENENVKYQQSSFLRGFCREIACSSLRVFRVDSVKGLCVLHFAWLLLLIARVLQKVF